MTELKHDPDFPYVVLIREDHGPDYILGKFSDIAYAIQLKNAGIASFREIVDTTPKTKIPENAEFITWRPDDNSALEFAENTQGFWAWGADEVSVAELVTEIGDAEVIVLVRKEDA